MGTASRVTALAAVLAVICPGAPLVHAQAAPANLLGEGVGPGAWEPRGDAKSEQFLGVTCLAVRSPGSFTQTVTLASTAAGMYGALVGLGQSDRINTDGSITGMPYLYATVWSANPKRVLAYWQGAASLLQRPGHPHTMMALPESPTDWVKMYGLFQIPKGAAVAHVRLSQGERRGSPADGSVARFRDVRLHLFPTEQAGREFVKQYMRDEP